MPGLKQVNIRIPEDELYAWQEKAGKADVSLANWIRGKVALAEATVPEEPFNPSPPIPMAAKPGTAFAWCQGLCTNPCWCDRSECEEARIA